MQRQRFSISSIHTGSRNRTVDPKKVAQIAESIKAVGLLNPPTVRMVDEVMMDGELVHHVPVLVCGNHRMRALEANGETVIECFVVDADDDHAELMEIDENLARAELTPAQVDEHFLRREVLWKRMKAREMEAGGPICPTSLADGRGAGHQHLRQFAAEVASITGDSKRDINRKLARARVLQDDIHEIVGTSLDKGVEMDALIKLPEPERKQLIQRAASGEKVSARDVPVKRLPDPPHPDEAAPTDNIKRLIALVAEIRALSRADKQYLHAEIGDELASA